MNNSQMVSKAAGEGLLARSTVLVGIDDTDNLANLGTGWLAQCLLPQLACHGLGGAVASVDHRLGQRGLMRRRHGEVPTPEPSFAGFRFPPEVITLAVRSMPLSSGLELGL